jgi:hypothetical protein
MVRLPHAKLSWGRLLKKGSAATNSAVVSGNRRGRRMKASARAQRRHQRDCQLCGLRDIASRVDRPTVWLLRLGAAARVHPTLVIFCFLVAGFLFGIAGVILAVPTALTVKTVLAVMYEG